MKRGFLLRKGRLIQIINSRLFIVEDLFNNEKITTSISINQVKIGFTPEIGEIIYVVVSPNEKGRGRVLSKHDYKSEYMNSLLEQKSELDKQKVPNIKNTDKIFPLEEMRIYLLDSGWIEKMNYVIYDKNDYQIIFDVSDYIEVYSKSSKKRLGEGRVNTITELSILINSIVKIS